MPAARQRKIEETIGDAKLLKRIGRELRFVYSDLMIEPVPGHLADVLEELKQQDEGVTSEEAGRDAA